MKGKEIFHVLKNQWSKLWCWYFGKKIGLLRTEIHMGKKRGNNVRSAKDQSGFGRILTIRWGIRNRGAGCKAANQGRAWQAISSVSIGGMERRGAAPGERPPKQEHHQGCWTGKANLKLVFKEAAASSGYRLNMGTPTGRSSFFLKLWTILRIK